MARTTTSALLAAALTLAAAARAVAGIADPPDSGTVLWVFNGVKNTADIATVVHCTNLDSGKATNLVIEFYAESGPLVASGSQNDLQPGQSVDVATGSGTTYAEMLVPTGSFEGAVRVISDSTKKVMCSAQVMSAAIPPTFAFSLPPFTKAAKH